MDLARYSRIAHDGLLLWNPLPEAATFALVDALDAGPRSRVVDIGCGRATLLIRLLERTGATGTGVDRDGRAIALARADAAGRVDAARLSLGDEDFDARRFDDGSFDVALCIGATHAAGGYHATLRALRRLLAPGGVALVGEGHWLRVPDPEYLAFLGAAPDELTDHDGNVRAASGAGFDVLRAEITPRQAFDAYEDRYAANVERFVAMHPDDPDADAFGRRISAWREAYARWGRDTLGFALYVLRSRAA